MAEVVLNSQRMVRRRERCYACGGLGSSWRYRLTIAAWWGEPGAQVALGRVRLMAARRFHGEVWARAAAAAVAVRVEQLLRDVRDPEHAVRVLRAAVDAGILEPGHIAEFRSDHEDSRIAAEEWLPRIRNGADIFALAPAADFAPSSLALGVLGGLLERFTAAGRFVALLRPLPLKARRREGVHSAPTYVAQAASHALALMDDPAIASAMCREVAGWALNGDDPPRDRLRANDRASLDRINRARARGAGLVLRDAPLVREPRHAIRPLIS